MIASPAAKSALFFLGLSLLACHELDAVARHEWRLMVVLERLDDETGFLAFVLGHVPAFAALFWLTAHDSPRVRWWSRLVVDVFLVVHAGLHYSMSGDPLYEFRPPVETITVYGGAVVGMWHAGVTGRGTGAV